MRELIEQLSSYKELALVLTGVSVAMFVGSLLMVPWVVARAPRDVFRGSAAEHRRARALWVTVFRNVCGAVLLLAGLAMLVLPGQGLLTIVVAVALLDIPAKHALLVKLARRPGLMRALNYLRRRAHREPFEPPE